MHKKSKSCKCKCPKSSRPSPQRREEQERKKLMKELQVTGKYTSSSQPKEISFWSKRDKHFQEQEELDYERLAELARQIKKEKERQESVKKSKEWMKSQGW